MGGAFKRAAGLLPPKTKATRLSIFGPYQVEPESVCDRWFETVQGPRVFAWNWTKHIRLPRWGFDFDGVLCRDNTQAANDDVTRYAEFLADAEPRSIQQRPIGPLKNRRASSRERARTNEKTYVGAGVFKKQYTPANKRRN